MLEAIKKLDSLTIRGLIVATIPLLVLIASFFGIDEAVFQTQLEGIGEKIVALVSLAGVAYAAYARLFKPTPPLTETAKTATAQMVADGKIAQTPVPPAAPESKQGGFARMAMLAVLLSAGTLTLVSVTACTNTTQAFRNADTPSDYALIFLEGYDAALRSANQLKQTGALTGEKLALVQAAEKRAYPLVAKVDPLRRAYEATRSAEDAAALQLAIDNAIREAADFIRLVRESRA